MSERVRARVSCRGQAALVLGKPTRTSPGESSEPHRTLSVRSLSLSRVEPSLCWAPEHTRGAPREVDSMSLTPCTVRWHAVWVVRGLGRSRAPKRGAKGCGWRMHASVHVRVALRCYIHLSHRDPPRIVGMPITRRTARGGGASAMECACGGSSCPYHRVPAAVTPGSARRPGGHHVR